MTLISDVATRALADDFDPGKQGDAERFVKEGVQMVFRTTTLARGGTMLACTAVLNTTTITGFAAIVGARITGILHADNGDELDETDDMTLKAAQLQTPAQRGRPRVYAITGQDSPVVEQQQILIWPVPDKTYNLLARTDREPGSAALTGASTLPLPDAYERLPEYFARQELYAREGDLEMAAYWENRWTLGCRELRGDLQRLSGKNRRIAGTWSDGSGALVDANPSFHYGNLF
jgi:hypothetical protein